MSDKPPIQYLVYRIYDGRGIAYVGQTAQPLNRRLHEHFFSKPMMRKLDPRAVTRIEYAVCKSRSDMNVYERYYIELMKPPFNFADKNHDELTVRLPELLFVEHKCKLMEKWRSEIEARDAERDRVRKLEIELEPREQEQCKAQRSEGGDFERERHKVIGRNGMILFLI